MKKTILFAVDLQEWAYHNIAQSYCSYWNDYDAYYYLTKDYEIKKGTFHWYHFFFYNLINAVRLFFCRLFGIQKKLYFIDKSLRFSTPIYPRDKIYRMEDNQLCKIKSADILWEMAYYFQYTSARPKIFCKKKFVGIFTDSFPHEGPSFDVKKNIDVASLSLENFYQLYLQYYDGIVVGSKNLFDKYQHIAPRILFSNNILGQDKFQENRQVGAQEGLCIAWTGNPHRSMKNFYRIVEPSIKTLQKKGLKIVLKTKFEGPYEELFNFYSNVDLVVIASEADAGPSLFAEASLSNVPAVSTNVGFPKMVIQNFINGIIVEDNNVQAFSEAIEKLYHDRSLLKSFSKRIKNDYLAQLDNYKMANDLKKFFETYDYRKRPHRKSFHPT